MTNRDIRKEKLEELAELIRGNQTLIKELIGMAKNEKEQLYMMTILENEVYEPAVGLDGQIVAGTLDEVHVAAEDLLAMLPDYYRDNLDVQFIEIDPNVLEELEAELSEFYGDIEDAAENAAYEVSDFVADPERVKSNIASSIKADLRTAGVGLSHNGKIARTNSTYWSEQEVPEEYYDEYDDNCWDDCDEYDCCDCDCECNEEEGDSEGDILDEILNIIKKF